MHVHVQHAEGEAKFWLEPQIEVAENYGLSRRRLAKALQLVQENENGGGKKGEKGDRLRLVLQIRELPHLRVAKRSLSPFSPPFSPPPFSPPEIPRPPTTLDHVVSGRESHARVRGFTDRSL
jgi:hypothetical protein